MFDTNALLAAARCTLPIDEQLSGRGNTWAVVTNKYLQLPDWHLSDYKKVN